MIDAVHPVVNASITFCSKILAISIPYRAAPKIHTFGAAWYGTEYTGDVPGVRSIRYFFSRFFLSDHFTCLRTVPGFGQIPVRMGNSFPTT